MSESAPNGMRLPVVHVVDDDAAVRESLGALLESYGYIVRTYPGGEAFLTAHPGGYSGCLVADLHMPGMSGIELVDALRRAGRGGPAIVVTGRGDPGLRELASRAGAFALLDKPVDAERLCAVIDDAVSVAA